MRPLDELASEIRTLAGHINAANYRFLLLIAEFDRRSGWASDGAQSCAHWLNWKCGIGLGAAREKVRVARALENLPRMSAAMASGSLSYSKAREITRIGNESNEAYLLSIAEHGTAVHVERLVCAYRGSAGFESCGGIADSAVADGGWPFPRERPYVGHMLEQRLLQLAPRMC